MKNAILIALCSFLLAGCAGYQLGAPKPKRMAGVNSLTIPVTKNDTFEPRVEVLVSNAIIKQFHQDGTYPIVQPDRADAILNTKITEIRRYRARSVRGNVVQTREFVLELHIAYDVVSKATSEVLSRGTVTGTTSFFVSDDIQQDERQGIPLAAEEAAVELVSKLSEGW